MGGWDGGGPGPRTGQACVSAGARPGTEGTVLNLGETAKGKTYRVCALPDFSVLLGHFTYVPAVIN